jgi:uncharacterized 2Fe-2S/4Fe-4S cluster protein (DUF4445 family)
MDTTPDAEGGDASDAASAPRRHRLRFPALEREIDCREDEHLLAAARRAGVRIVGACGGRGTCGSCVVRVTAGRVHRDGEGAHKTWLRACRVRPHSDLTLEVAPRSLAPVVRTDVDSGARDAALPLAPAVRALTVDVPPPGLNDLASDVARVRRALPCPVVAVDAGAVAALPALLRTQGWRVGVRVAACAGGSRIVGFTRPDAPLLGLAVDLGTTNAAAFLVDLATGRRLASLGIENPQTAWGADLVSRIDHAAKDPAAAQALRAAALTAIDALARDLARAVGARAEDIADVAVCGNTAMQHLLLGWPVAQLGRAPFVAAMSDAVVLPAQALGLQLGAGAAVHLAPGIGGFVGGDHVAALLATEPQWRREGTTLVIDIGTNTEISLVRDRGGAIWSASCPSGPALEGGHIGCGMRAAEGAIERVEIEGETLRLGVIGAADAVGLCGSGVVDALAAFVAAGWVDRRGRIVGKGAAIGSVDGVRAITLAEAKAQLPALHFSQPDVRAVQLAKAAIRTGIVLLAAEAGSTEADIDRVVIAGAFGAYLRVQSCVAIGLLPPLPRERFVQVGNAAGLGVQQMLASTAQRERAAEIATKSRYVELSTRADFQKTFLHHLGFAP